MSSELIIGLVAVVVSLATYVHARQADRRLRQAELLRAYTNDFYSDPRVTTIFMDVDHGRFTLAEEHLGTAAELSLIRLLDFFNIVGHNWRQGVLRLEDIVPTTVGYAAVRVYRDPAVRWYFDKIAVWDEQRYDSGMGFGYFRQLAEALESRLSTPRRTGVRRLLPRAR